MVSIAVEKVNEFLGNFMAVSKNWSFGEVPGEKNACQSRGSDFTLTCKRRPDGNQKIEESLGVIIQSRGLSWVEI